MWNRYRPEVNLSSAKPLSPKHEALHAEIEKIAWYVSEEQRTDFEAAVRVLCGLARGDVFYYRDGEAMTNAGLDPDNPLHDVSLTVEAVGNYPPDPGDQGTRYVLPGGTPA